MLNNHTATEDEKNHKDIDVLYRAIKRLNEIDRAIILLYLEKKPYEEIAEVMGLKPNHIGVKINRIKNKLKLIINEIR